MRFAVVALPLNSSCCDETGEDRRRVKKAAGCGAPRRARQNRRSYGHERWTKNEGERWCWQRQLLDEAESPARQARYPSGTLMVCREAGAKGTRCGSYRKPREFVWIFRCAIFLCLTRSQEQDRSDRACVTRPPDRAAAFQRYRHRGSGDSRTLTLTTTTGGTANRSAGRLLTGRTRRDAHHRSYSSDSEKSMSPVSDQLRFTNEKSVLPVQPATDGNAAP